jgi:subtilisin family serine protease
VVSISLTAGTRIPEIDAAIQRLTATNVTVVAAAGNDDKDACTTSPARDAGVMAVASVDASNTRAKDSNWGTCVALFAPGVGIKSAWNTSDTATAIDSGTSMASPYVAGLAARYLQFHPSSPAADVAENVRATSSVSLVKNAGTNTPNLLAASVKER